MERQCKWRYGTQLILVVQTEYKVETYLQSSLCFAERLVRVKITAVAVLLYNIMIIKVGGPVACRCASEDWVTEFFPPNLANNVQLFSNVILVHTKPLKTAAASQIVQRETTGNGPASCSESIPVPDTS